jgi:glycosyltransferase involved in cell wall biosynthesis
MRIRVVSIISRMNVGGPAILLRDLFENLDSSDFEHILITGRCADNEIDYLDERPMKSRVIYVGSVRRKIGLFSDLGSLIQLIYWLVRLRPDIVHTHTSKAGILGRIAAKIANPHQVLVHTYHGHLLYGYFSPNISKLFTLFEKFATGISTWLVSITKQVQVDLKAVGIGVRKPWTVIAPAIEVGSPLDSKVARHSLGLNESHFVLVWVGRFEAIKNPFLAIHSFELLAQSSEQKIEMFMVGDGLLWQECYDYVHKHDLAITMVGWALDVSRYLAASDLLLLTSINEGFGIVMLEAAEQNVPTLATKVGGINEFLQPEVTGFYSDANPESFAKRIHELSREQTVLERVGLAANKLLKDRFSKEEFIAKHRDLYKELLQLRRSQKWE